MLRVVVGTVTVAPRFRGPPESGNGGYVAGLVAGFCTGATEVRLVAPPPLSRALGVHRLGDGVVELRDGEAPVAVARPAELDLEVPPAPGWDEAREAATRFVAREQHHFPGCFVCGPDRAADDGLCVHPGAVRPGLVAAPWRPHASLAKGSGLVAPEYLWAALDCPGYFAAAPDLPLMLLGTLTARVDGCVAVGEPCVVAGWALGAEGRRRLAGTAVYAADGACVARAAATWIELRGSA